MLFRSLVGGIFAGHPWNAGDEHAFAVDDPGHPIVKSLPDAFRWKDEIYQYDTRFVPDDVRVLVSLDMPHSTPKEPWHVPVSWIRDFGHGRVFYTNFGHNEATWREPRLRKHMEQGMAWALGRFEAPAEPNVVQPQPEEQLARVLPQADNGLRRPQPARPAPGALGDALRNLQRYVQNERFDNPQGGQDTPGASIQFDTKGVEFGPWLRRFIGRVRRACIARLSLNRSAGKHTSHPAHGWYCGTSSAMPRAPC